MGIDRFMSEARALTNFAGNAVATILIGSWARELDVDQARRVLSGEDPFNETTFLDEPSHTVPHTVTSDGFHGHTGRQKGDHR